ncbi:MAG: CHASE domain-containing protein [Sulfuricurvum sp.]|uniref:CHASE domain-containing protein n=1 Tax=Sulfuricurvum sp. TaxID=2025608 RepID=UPI002623BB33|nr:CHASE domain-containing protein [Sulfuricurvum sp.]MDD2829869.1 CHASE domain-containing protein [Sulfuricurvum sp.]
MDEAKNRFKSNNIETIHKIEIRMHAYETILQSSMSLLSTVEHMNQHKWFVYVSSMQIEKHYPGFQGIGYSKIIQKNQLPKHIEQMRADGFKNYLINPLGNRLEYHPIIYLEPLTQRNIKAIGYDMFTNPIRQKAMTRARDTGETTLSGKVTLVQEQNHDVQPGFLMYVPFYNTHSTLLSSGQREQHLEGFTFAPFRAHDLIDEILQKKDPHISIKIYDGTTIIPQNLLYESDHVSNHSPLFVETIPLKMYGHTWSIRFETLPTFKETIDNAQPHLIVLAGLPISFLLLLTLLAFYQTAARARLLAQSMTSEIRMLNTELENMINITPNPIIVHAEDGTILKMNQTWSTICGYSYEETPTIDTWVDKVYKDHQKEIKQYIRNLSNITQKVDEGEFSFYNKSGALIIWQFSSAPFGTINGQKTIISSAMDVTELKNKDNMLIMQSRHAAMGEMINMIAHQWRQPLASISAIAGTLQVEAMLDQYDQNHFIEKLNSISDLAIDLSDTINDFRNFSKKDKIKELATWKQLINGSLAIIQPILTNQNIELHISETRERSFMTYPREIRQVILNILKNAEDVLIENEIKIPQIWIRVLDQDGKPCLEIEDNGGGIPPEIIDKIFDPYFSTKFEKEGTGIGLYMSKMIVEHHNGGKLNAYNTNHGACFQIILQTDDYLDVSGIAE